MAQFPLPRFSLAPSLPGDAAGAHGHGTHQPQAHPRLAEGGAAADQPDDEHHHSHTNNDHGRQQGVLVLQKVVVALVGVDDVRPDIAEPSSCCLKCNKEK